MKKIILLTTLFFLLLSNTQLLSQPEITNYHHYNDVYDIAIDKTNNFVWLATRGGVVVRDFNGNEIERHHKYTDDTPGLSSNFITAIAIDDAGNYWFGSANNGVTRTSDGTEGEIYNQYNSNICDSIIDITIDINGSAWFATKDSLYRYDGGSNFKSFGYISSLTSEISNVQSIYADGIYVYCAADEGLFRVDVNDTDNGWVLYDKVSMNISAYNLTSVVANGTEIFVGTNGGGIAYYDGGWQATPFTNTSTAGLLGNDFINNLSLNPSGRLYAATDQNIYYYEADTWHTWAPVSTASNSYVGTIACDNNDNVWFGYKHEGYGVSRAVNDAAAAGKSDYTIDETIPKSDINDIEIEGNNIVIGTNGGGLCVFDGSNWEIYNTVNSSIISNNVRDISIDSDNNYWIATNGGVSYFDGTSWTTHKIPDIQSNDVRAIEYVASDNIWIGTDAGVDNYDGASWNPTTITESVIAMTIDKDGNVWALHDNAVSVYYVSAWIQSLMITVFDSGVKFSDIDAEKGEGTGVWITSNQGIVHLQFDAGSITNQTKFTYNDGLLSNNVISVHIDEANVKHFGHKNAGISIFNNEGRARIRSEQGLATSNVKAICNGGNPMVIWSGGGWGGLSASTINELQLNIENTTQDCNSPITLFANANGGFGNFIYSWTSESEDFFADTETITDNAEEVTQYFVTVTDGMEVKDDSIEINPNSSENVEIILKGEKLLICIDSGLSEYQWFRGEELINEATEQYYSIPDQENITGEYYVQTTTEAGCISVSNIINIDGTSVKIYPNPSSDIVNIDINNNLIGNGTLKIRDANGKTIYTENFSKQEKNKLLNINLVNKMQGIFYIDIFIDNKFCLSEKIIVN